MLVKLSIRFIMVNCLEYCSITKFLIALILECINATTVSLVKNIPKLLPMHSETDIPKAWPNSSGNIQTYKGEMTTNEHFWTDSTSLLNPEHILLMYCVIVYMLTITHYENQDSDLLDIKTGIPQGSILGSINF